MSALADTNPAAPERPPDTEDPVERGAHPDTAPASTQSIQKSCFGIIDSLRNIDPIDEPPPDGGSGGNRLPFGRKLLAGYDAARRARRCARTSIRPHRHFGAFVAHTALHGQRKTSHENARLHDGRADLSDLDG